MYEDKLYNFIFSSGIIYTLLYILIQFFSFIILSNIVDLSGFHEQMISISITVIFLFFLFIIISRKRKLFPKAFFLIGRGVERRENNIRLRKTLLNSFPIAIFGFIIDLIL